MTGHRPWSEIKHKKDDGCPRCGKVWINGTCDSTISRRTRCRSMDRILGDLDVDRDLIDSQPPGINHWSYIMDNCTCPEVHLNNALKPDVVGRNWSERCPEHGLKSEWWKSPEQVAKREADCLRLRDLQEQARRARARARAMAAHPSTPRSQE